MLLYLLQSSGMLTLTMFNILEIIRILSCNIPVLSFTHLKFLWFFTLLIQLFINYNFPNLPEDYGYPKYLINVLILGPQFKQWNQNFWGWTARTIVIIKQAGKLTTLESMWLYRLPWIKHQTSSFCKYSSPVGLGTSQWPFLKSITSFKALAPNQVRISSNKFEGRDTIQPITVQCQIFISQYYSSMFNFTNYYLIYIYHSFISKLSFIFY